VTANVVQVREVEPPVDDVPVEWLLVTTLPIETAADVRRIVEYYAMRSMIEVLFRVLKSGCRVEERRFEHLDRLLPCVALSLIVAWRTLLVCWLGRSDPEFDGEAVFEPSEWKAVWMATKRTRRPPKLEEFVPKMSQLGGYVNTPGRSDPPGQQTVRLGLQRMSDLALAWETFGPGAAATPPDRADLCKTTRAGPGSEGSCKKGVCELAPVGSCTAAGDEIAILAGYDQRAVRGVVARSGGGFSPGP